MSTPVFQPYTPGINDDVNSKIRGLTNAYTDVVQQLQWILQHLDSSNVTRLDTSRTVIRSNAGETQIDGPLLVMKDKQGTPVIRLLMGYDSASLDFVYQLMNAAGDITVDIDSSGNLTVERGTFKGSITIGTGNNVFKADGATGIWLGHADFASAPFKVGIDGSATATNLTIVGGVITGSTIQTAASGERMVMNSNGIISYSGAVKEGVVIEKGPYGYGALQFYQNGNLMGELMYNNAGVFALSAPNADMYIWNTIAQGAWAFSGATVTGLEDSGYKKGATTGTDSHTHTVVVGGTTYTTSEDTHSHTQT